jgi:hypothetical protein
MTVRLPITILSAVFGLAACAPSEAPRVSYSADVKPILERYCSECHQPGTAGYEASGFSVATYEDVIEGTRYGPVVIPGDAFNSNLIILVEGRADPAIAMPHDGHQMLGQEIETLKSWIQQGAPDN